MRLVLFGDLHLDAPFIWLQADRAIHAQRRQALRETLRNIVELTQAEKADALLCSGDLFEHDRTSPDTGAFLKGIFEELHPTPVIIAPGNHDWFGPQSLYALTQWSPNVHVFSKDRLGAHELEPGLILWGAAHCAPVTTANFLDGFSTGSRGGVHLALMHASENSWWQDEASEQRAYAPFRAEQISQAGLHHALLGPPERPSALVSDTPSRSPRRPSRHLRWRPPRLTSRLGLSAPDPDRGRGLLRAWRKEKLGEVSQRRRAVREWARLEELLQGGSLDELRAEAERLQKRADQTLSRYGLAEAQVKSLQISDHEAEDAARKAAEEARAEAERRKGMVEEMTKRLPNVAEAEEDLSAAEVELSSVGRLQSTLQRTREFLLDAQERVHLDIAPHLQGSVERWLEDVTEGRYREVRVDPEKLEVKVRTNNGEFRDATYLSHGTAEQIYLLLRVGLAERLTRRGEACPLLLDDVLVQCDSTRKRAVLEVLKEISTERQVNLFSQEDEVLAWGQQHLTESQHSIRELDPNEIAE